MILPLEFRRYLESIQSPLWQKRMTNTSDPAVTTLEIQAKDNSQGNEDGNNGNGNGNGNG